MTLDDDKIIDTTEAEETDRTFLDEDSSEEEFDERQFLREDDYIWPGKASEVRKRYPHEEVNRHGIIKEGMFRRFEHWDNGHGKHDFEERQVYTLQGIRSLDVPIYIRLPIGVGRGFEGINFGCPFVMEHMMGHIMEDFTGEITISQPERREGSIKIEDGKVKIVLGRRRIEKMTEDETSALFFKTAHEDREHWRGAGLSPSFYKRLIWQNLDNSPENTPLKWAAKRAELAIGFVFKMGYGDDLPADYLVSVPEKLAGRAINLHQKELDREREFAHDEKAKRLMELLGFKGKDPVPETVNFVLENQAQISEEDLKDPQVEKLLAKMPTYLENGLVIDRMSELFTITKSLIATLRIINGIFGGKKIPWYFRENINFKELLKYEEAKDIEDIIVLAEKTGPNFEHVAIVYFFHPLADEKERSIGQILKDHMGRKQAIAAIAQVVDEIGIDNPHRALNSLGLLIDTLEKTQQKEKANFTKLFLEHSSTSRPYSKTIGYMEGAECSTKLPGLDTLIMAIYGDAPKDQGMVFDDNTMGQKELGLLEKGINQPLGQRCLLPPAMSNRFGRHPLLAGTSRQLLLTAGRTATAEVTRQEPKNILHRILELYEQARVEIGSPCVEKVLRLYFATFATKMPDPLCPIPGLLKLIALIEKMPEMERINISLFGNPFNGEREYGLREQVPRYVTRSLALLHFLNARISGEISAEKFREFMGFLCGENFKVRFREPLEKYLERKEKEYKKYLEREEKEKKEEDEFEYLSPEEKKKTPEQRREERVRSHLDHCQMEYDSKLRTVRDRELGRRVDDMVRVAEAAQAITSMGETIGAEVGSMYDLLVDRLMGSRPRTALRKNPDLVEYGDDSEEAKELYGKHRASNWGILMGKGKDFEGYLKEIISSPEIAQAVEKFRAEYEAQKDPREKTRLVLQLFTEIRIIQSLDEFYRTTKNRLYTELKLPHDVRDIDMDEFERRAFQMGREARGTEKERLMAIKEEIERIQQLLVGEMDLGKSEMEFGNFRFIPEKRVLRTNSIIDKIKETIAVLAAMVEIRETVRKEVGLEDERVSQNRGWGGEEWEDFRIREATRITLGVIGSVTAMMYHDKVEETAEKIKLLVGAVQNGQQPSTEGAQIIPFPGQHAVAARNAGVECVKTDGEIDPKKLRTEIVERFKVALPELKSWIERVRAEDIGLLPVGGKIQVLHPIDEESFERIKDILGLRSTQFRLIHANKSLILPPAITAKEFSVLIFCLQQLGFITEEHPELQLAIPGRLDNERAGILGVSILLSTELGKEYPRNSFVTTHNETGTRMMIYDAGISDVNYPYMTTPNGGKLVGRTDMLGRRAVSDAEPYRILGTALVHEQFGMAFGDIGDWYVKAFKQLLLKYQMCDVLDAKWVLDPGKREDLDSTNKDQNRHYDMIKKCTDAYFACADGKTDIVFAVRDLLAQLTEKIKQRQAEILANPEKYESVYKDYKRVLTSIS